MQRTGENVTRGLNPKKKSSKCIIILICLIILFFIFRVIIHRSDKSDLVFSMDVQETNFKINEEIYKVLGNNFKLVTSSSSYRHGNFDYHVGFVFDEKHISSLPDLKYKISHELDSMWKKSMHSLGFENYPSLTVNDVIVDYSNRTILITIKLKNWSDTHFFYSIWGQN